MASIKTNDTLCVIQQNEDALKTIADSITRSNRATPSKQNKNYMKIDNNNNNNKKITITGNKSNL